MGTEAIYFTRCHSVVVCTPVSAVVINSEFSFNALTLLVGQQEGHLAYKKLGVDLLLVTI